VYVAVTQAMTGFIRLALLLLTTVVPTGCALVEPTYVYVDAIASDHAGPQETYFLFSGRPGLTTEDLQFRRLARHADEALGAAGLRKVESADEADVVVGFTYGVESVREGNVIRRTSHVELTAFDWDEVRDQGDRNAIWRTQAYMDGSHGGLGRVVPMMVEACAPWLGRSTGGIVEVEFD
jgi:hypothetical protein